MLSKSIAAAVTITITMTAGGASWRHPFAYVESGRRVVVEAPFTTVYVGRRGRYVRAPFVNIWIPR